MISSSLLAAAIALTPVTTTGAVSVFGKSTAHECFDAVEIARTDATLRRAYAACSAAIRDRSLTSADAAASFANRGVVNLRKGDYAAALADFDQALDIDPDMADAHTNRAGALIGLDRFEDALAALDAAEAFGSKNEAAMLVNRGLAYEGAGDLDAAYAALSAALAVDPASEAARIELARYRLSE